MGNNERKVAVKDLYFTCQTCGQLYTEQPIIPTFCRSCGGKMKQGLEKIPQLDLDEVDERSTTPP